MRRAASGQVNASADLSNRRFKELQMRGMLSGFEGRRYAARVSRHDLCFGEKRHGDENGP